VTRINHPDDQLFGALIQLFFADRGLHIPADALRFMAERLHRITGRRSARSKRSTVSRSANGRGCTADDSPRADRLEDDR
jgi:chromosomal replication initiation ATPase DnaA